jgi:hypothetical protein
MTERRPLSFKQRDVTRAVRAAKAAGLPVHRVEIDPRTGCIVIDTGAGAAPMSGGNELDRWLERKHAR